MTIVLLGALALWMLLSVANQLRGLRGRLLNRLSSFGLLQDMSLMAPDPPDVDLHMLIRDIYSDGTETAWRQVPIGGRGSRLRALWNPTDREAWKLMLAVTGVAVVNEHLGSRSPDPESVVSISLPFLYLLNLAMAPERAPGAVSRQFMIVESKGFGEERQIELGILSSHHAFDDPPADR